jgi:OmpA-OmpF porin, OOP family
MRSCVAAATALFGILITCAVPAQAQTNGATDQPEIGTGIALDQFEPTAPGDTFFGVPSAYARGHLIPRALAYFDYASQPLKLTQGSNSATVVGRQGILHIGASFAIQNRLLITALLPVAVAQNGGSPTVQGVKLDSPAKAEVGDLRFGARVRMIGENDDVFQLGIGLNAYFPTAPKGSLIGEGTVRMAPQLLLGGRFHAGLDFLWVAAAGAMIRASSNPSALTYGAGFAATMFNETLQFGPEIYAATPLQEGQFSLTDQVKIPANVATNAELLFGIRVRMLKGLMIGWAAGPGLTRAIGTPTLRFVGSIGWSPALEQMGPQTDPDSDGDGLPDRVDACPHAYGPASRDRSKSGCPITDDDEDGVPNDEDACPHEYGKPSPDKKQNGCPVKLAPIAPVAPGAPSRERQ